ncbi:MAG: hypothetical protein P0Y50_09645 [Candidatus Brevundimonas colombiensis]|uniref:Uncharacterized protein n=1 Tax=Candidatus Brevundimonas colombiensis TaxID=3121376 RepID=A0AAJ6BJY7_9CAUL|nr:hypothetical protein [Brevundimonas sp.]WEK38812.1 MAG: hypothetical protein P0Y50_09645 [Brevundimonas sp.]
MILAVLSTGLAIIGGGLDEAEQPALPADQLAQTCLSESAGLFVLSIAAGRESPNEKAAQQAKRISEICRDVRTQLQPLEHVCLNAVAENEHLAQAIADVYSGHISPPSFASAQAERASTAEADDHQTERNSQCEGRMSALKQMTLAGESQ